MDKKYYQLDFGELMKLRLPVIMPRGYGMRKAIKVRLKKENNK